jgi:hypothetical protein
VQSRKCFRKLLVWCLSTILSQSIAFPYNIFQHFFTSPVLCYVKSRMLTFPCYNCHLQFFLLSYYSKIKYCLSRVVCQTHNLSPPSTHSPPPLFVSGLSLSMNAIKRIAADLEMLGRILFLLLPRKSYIR